MAKLMAYLFKVVYPQLFHFILGVVLASTVMIVPSETLQLAPLELGAAGALLVLGIWLGWWMSRLDQRVRTSKEDPD
jgi:Predicted membrane protein